VTALQPYRGDYDPNAPHWGHRQPHDNPVVDMPDDQTALGQPPQRHGPRRLGGSLAAFVGRLTAKTPQVPVSATRQGGTDLALREVIGNLTLTNTTITAWFKLRPRRWMFRGDDVRNAEITAIAGQLAALEGHRIHWRRTTRPFPVADWAATLDQDTAVTVPADANSWQQHLDNAAEHLAVGDYQMGETYLGVEFAVRTLGDIAYSALRRVARRGDSTDVTDEELLRLLKRVRHFDEILSQPEGLGATRATEEELAWLLYKSVALGHEPDSRRAHLDPGDVAALAEDVDLFEARYGDTVMFRSRSTGRERHVVILTVGRMEELEIPEVHLPWLHAAAVLPDFPVEISVRGQVVPPDVAAKSIGYRIRRVRNQQDHFAEHGLDSPLGLERVAAEALEVSDKLESGRPEEATWFNGWVRLAVWGDTRQEALDRATELERLYNQHLRMTLRHPKDQARLAREFIPGERAFDSGYLREMPVMMLASAMPHADPGVGSFRGDLIGHTSGIGRSPVFLNPHLPMELLNKSGVIGLIGEPGSGKSTLMGTLAYLSVRRGVETTLIDPSGLLVGLAALPELRSHTRVMNLAAAAPGTLSPYGLVPTPSLVDYPSTAEGAIEYAEAVKAAKAERYANVLDTCRHMLDPAIAADPDVIDAISRAAWEVPRDEGSTLEQVISQLELMAGRATTDLAERRGARRAALGLEQAMEMPGGALFFGQSPTDAPITAPLTILTIGGLQVDRLDQPPERWSVGERMSFIILQAGLRLAVRRCYGGDRNRRKLIAVDEGHFVGKTGSGRDLLTRVASDSRKFNLAAVFASQNPADILGIDRLKNLMPTVFVGRVAGKKEILEGALELLELPTGEGYEEVVAALSAGDGEVDVPYRDFIMRDALGRVQKVRINVMDYVPGLRAALDTTPASRTARHSRRGSPGQATTGRSAASRHTDGRLS
jgi:hypothetical protein